MNTFKKLDKSEMKMIVGGSDEIQSIVGDGSKYKCCWTGTNNCSVCETHSSKATCVNGATLTAC
jgi:natural product precursor